MATEVEPVVRRLVIAEADRFPQLGRAYYERGPGRTAEALAAHFRRLAERGRCAWTTRSPPPTSSPG